MDQATIRLNMMQTLREKLDMSTYKNMFREFYFNVMILAPKGAKDVTHENTEKKA